MHKRTKIVSMLFTFVLVLAVGVSFGVPATGTNNSATKTTTRAVTKTKPATGKSAMKSMTKSSARKTDHALASAEDLSGTITLVDPSDKEITLVGSNGVPYDFVLTKKTRIEVANTNQKIAMNELSSESHKQATIHFVPDADGNLAESIQIKAS
jgi:U3 small nucleolar RNA-associated protein 14